MNLHLLHFKVDKLPSVEKQLPIYQLFQPQKYSLVRNYNDIPRSYLSNYAKLPGRQ